MELVKDGNVSEAHLEAFEEGDELFETQFNALDALEGVAHPTIQIRLHASNGGVEVSIRDNGSEMSDVTRARVFEPFFTTKPIGRGTGLGLSIAYGAVKSHGGTIEIESAVGAGTTVSVCLRAV